jgi:hypothetical protein
MRWYGHVNELKQWVPECLWGVSVFVATGSPVIPKTIKQASEVSYMGFLGDLISWLKVIKVFNPYFILFDYNGFHGTVWCQE